MRWEQHLLDVFDDLEQQADGLALVERDALVAEQSRAEYAEVALADRLHASVGARLLVDVAGVGALAASLVRVGHGWFLVEVDRHEWIVVQSAVRSVRGLADGAVRGDARPLTARLGLGSALRGVAGARSAVVLHRSDSQVARGMLGRVGADFVEVYDEAGDPRGHVEVLPFIALAAVRDG